MSTVMMDFMTLLKIWTQGDWFVVQGNHFLYLFYVMLADFQADGRLFIVNDSVKRAKRGSARAAEQVFRTRELMPSGAVAEL